MKKIGIIAVILATVATAFSISQDWKVVEAENVKVHFELPGEGTTGTFSGLKTTIHFDKSDLSKSKIEASVDAATVNTDNEGRDNHLKNADFFDVTVFSTISFMSTEIVASENSFIAKGNLTMKGIAHPVEVPFEFAEDGSGKATLKGKMSILPFKWGVFKSKKAENQAVNITIEVPLTK